MAIRIISFIHFWSLTTICKNIFSMLKNCNLQLIQYKKILRYHYTGHRLFKMGFITDTCSHCTQSKPDTYSHALWFCTPVNSLLIKILQTLTTYLDCRIPASPIVCLLGDTSTTDLNKNQTRILLIALAIAKKAILMNWKSRSNINIKLIINLPCLLLIHSFRLIVILHKSYVYMYVYICICVCMYVCI